MLHLAKTINFYGPSLGARVYMYYKKWLIYEIYRQYLFHFDH